MITSFKAEILNRDLDQIGKWTASFHLELSDNFAQDLVVQEAVAEIFNSISVLREKLERETKISKRSVLERVRSA